MIMNTEEIMRIIPHRPPFLFVDEVCEIGENRIAGRRRVRPDEFYFAGHFPREPIMPGVLIVEAIAQLSAIMVLRRAPGAIPLFMGIDHARFRRVVRPDDVLVLEAEIVHDRGNIVRVNGRAKVIDELACEATVMAMVKL